MNIQFDLIYFFPLFAQVFIPTCSVVSTLGIIIPGWDFPETTNLR
jgi:hypothetical protein